MDVRRLVRATATKRTSRTAVVRLVGLLAFGRKETCSPNSEQTNKLYSGYAAQLVVRFSDVKHLHNVALVQNHVPRSVNTYVSQAAHGVVLSSDAICWTAVLPHGLDFGGRHLDRSVTQTHKVWQLSKRARQVSRNR